MISAGHCRTFVNVAQFNVPESDATGHIRYPSDIDQYDLDQVIGFVYEPQEASGRDWIVYKMKNNALTGKSPGEVQRFF